MAYRQPHTWDDLMTAFRRNMTMHGHGSMGMPCLFCGAPDWLVFDVFAGGSPTGAMQMLAQGAQCSACLRSARSIMRRDSDGGRRYEIVQSAGADPPPWFLEHVPIRRIR
jgi:hypothetical protein